MRKMREIPIETLLEELEEAIVNLAADPIPERQAQINLIKAEIIRRDNHLNGLITYVR